MQRENLGSRLGFILLSAGCAIGIGNVWKFPYLCGQSGGGIFVIVYLFFLVVLGLPAMTMEFAMGRAAQKSPVKMYQELESIQNKSQRRLEKGLQIPCSRSVVWRSSSFLASGSTHRAFRTDLRR